MTRNVSMMWNGGMKMHDAACIFCYNIPDSGTLAILNMDSNVNSGETHMRDTCYDSECHAGRACALKIPCCHPSFSSSFLSRALCYHEKGNQSRSLGCFQLVLNISLGLVDGKGWCWKDVHAFYNL